MQHRGTLSNRKAGSLGKAVSPDLTIRPRRLQDDEQSLEIYHQYEKSFTLTLKSWRFHMDERARPPGMEPEMFMAELDGRVVGDWYLEPSRGAEADSYFAAIEVDRNLAGRGIGESLWQDLQRRLSDKSAKMVFAYTWEDEPQGGRFAERHGFHQTGRSMRTSRLIVAQANLDESRDLAHRLNNEGIVVESFASIGREDEEFMRELYEVITEASRDIPRTEEFKATPYEVWRENFLKDPETSPEATWIALEHSHPVGMANLFRPSTDRAVNGLTGVVSRSRGKGVARLLKLRTIEWARENGIEFIDTSNDEENAPMLAINVSLGYKPLPGRFEWLREW